MGQIVLSNCRDTTWIALSPFLTHIWRVDRAGTTVAVASCTDVFILFTDGFMTKMEHKDFDGLHKWGHMQTYLNSEGFINYFVWDNPNGQLRIFNINELHLMAAILARTYQHYRMRQLPPLSCLSLA
jgi:hypothetical protein